MVTAMGDDWDESMATNSMAAAEKVEDYNIKSNLNLLPVTHKDSDDEIRTLAYEGLKDLKLDDEPEYVERLEEELAIIKEKKFAPYFIVVRNMIQWAKKNDIMAGPDRDWETLLPDAQRIQVGHLV